MIDALQRCFEAHGDKKIAEKQTKYLRNLFPFFGVVKPLHHSLVKEVFKQFPLHNPDELSRMLETLWEKKEREYHYAALELSKKYRKWHTPDALKLFEQLIRTQSWWDSVDELATHHVGALCSRFPSLIPRMDQWIDDENLWIRRTAILFQLRYKEKTDARRLFSYCEKRMHEEEFFIRKAIGWALREYSKTDPEKVRAFLSQNRDRLSGLSLREGGRLLK